LVYFFYPYFLIFVNKVIFLTISFEPLTIELIFSFGHDFSLVVVTSAFSCLERFGQRVDSSSFCSKFADGLLNLYLWIRLVGSKGLSHLATGSFSLHAHV
jgi:hypothetical protein